MLHNKSMLNHPPFLWLGVFIIPPNTITIDYSKLLEARFSLAKNVKQGRLYVLDGTFLSFLSGLPVTYLLPTLVIIISFLLNELKSTIYLIRI